MKSIILSLCVIITSLLHSQTACNIDRNGDPVNVRGDLNILAAGCCCDYSWKSVSTTPPTTAATPTRFNLTADSLFINIATLGAQNMDTVFFKMNQRKGSRMLFTLQTNTVVFADVELIAGSGVDMGTWWKFAIDYFDRPTTFIMDKVYCVEWNYGTSSDAPDGFVELDGTNTGSPMAGDYELQNGSGFFSIQDSLDCGIYFTPSQLSLYCNDSPFGTSILLGTVDIQVACTDPASRGVTYVNDPAIVAPNTLIWQQYFLDYIEVWQGNGPPLMPIDHVGRHYHDVTTSPYGVYEGTAGGWVLLN